MTSNSFDERLERLSAIVDELEQGELPLEAGVALFKEGLALARSCASQLETAKNEVRLASQGVLTDFEPQAGEEG